MIHRRNFLIGLVAAPAIVRIDNIMPVKLFDPVLYRAFTFDPVAQTIHVKNSPAVVLPEAFEGAQYLVMNAGKGVLSVLQNIHQRIPLTDLAERKCVTLTKVGGKWITVL